MPIRMRNVNGLELETVRDKMREQTKKVNEFGMQLCRNRLLLFDYVHRARVQNKKNSFRSRIVRICSAIVDMQTRTIHKRAGYYGETSRQHCVRGAIHGLFRWISEATKMH